VRSKENIYTVFFHDCTTMQTLETDDNSKSSETDNLDSSDKEARVMLSLIIYDLFENHETISGGVPKKCTPLVLKDAPQLFVGVSGLGAENKFKKWWKKQQGVIGFLLIQSKLTLLVLKEKLQR